MPTVVFILMDNSKNLSKLKHSYGKGRSTMDEIDQVKKKNTMVTDALSPLELTGNDWIADKIGKKSMEK